MPPRAGIDPDFGADVVSSPLALPLLPSARTCGVLILELLVGTIATVEATAVAVSAPFALEDSQTSVGRGTSTSCSCCALVFSARLSFISSPSAPPLSAAASVFEASVGTTSEPSGNPTAVVAVAVVAAVTSIGGTGRDCGCAATDDVADVVGGSNDDADADDVLGVWDGVGGGAGCGVCGD